MSDPIVSINEIRRRARDAYAQGLTIDGSPFPLESTAHAHFIAEVTALQEGARARKKLVCGQHHSLVCAHA